MNECIEYISQLNSNIIENRLDLSNKLQLFKQCIAISFLKVYFQTFLEILLFSEN